MTVQLQIKACPEPGTGNVAVGINALDMWVMDLSKLSFQKVNLGDPKGTGATTVRNTRQTVPMPPAQGQ